MGEKNNSSSKNKDFTQMNQLYQRVEPVIKNIRTLNDGMSYAQTYNSLTDKNNYTDQALIFSYMKVLDPGSVVRSDEFSTAMKNQGALQGLGVSIDNIQGKAMLSDEARKNILGIMQGKYSAQMSNYRNELQGQNKIFTQLGYDPNLIYSQDFVFGGQQQSLQDDAQLYSSFNSGGGTSYDQSDLDFYNNL
jgi:hypothetical protein